jgi:hypothetical protein
MEDSVGGAGDLGPLEYQGPHKDPQVSDQRLSLGDIVTSIPM